MAKVRYDYHKANVRRARATELRTEFRKRLIQNVVIKDKKLYKSQIDEQMSIFGIGVRVVQQVIQYLRRSNKLGYDENGRYYNLTTEDVNE